MANRVIRIFKDTNMQNQHDGLAKIAMKNKVRVDQLGQGEHVVFINKACNYIKMYSANGVLTSKKEKGTINMHSIEMIPLCFDPDGKLNWDKADRLALEKQLAKYDKRKVTKDVNSEAKV